MSAQPERLEFILKSSIFDRPRQLTLDRGYIEFDDTELVSASPTRFSAKDLAAIRFGIKPIEGYRFNIGRVYRIDLMDTAGKIIKLRLKSIYGVRKKQLHNKYADIVNYLLVNYFDPVAAKYISLFKENQPFELLGVSVNAEGVLFSEKAGRISWNFVGTKRYWSYYTIFSETDPNQYIAFQYIEHWNATILAGVVDTILKLKFPKGK